MSRCYRIVTGNVGSSPVQIILIVTGWPNKPALVLTNIMVTAVACRLATTGVLVSADELVFDRVEVLYANQFRVCSGQEIRIVVYFHLPLGDPELVSMKLGASFMRSRRLLFVGNIRLAMLSSVVCSSIGGSVTRAGEGRNSIGRK